MPKLTNDAPDDAQRKKGVADEELAKKEAERARKRELEERDEELIRQTEAKRLLKTATEVDAGPSAPKAMMIALYPGGLQEVGKRNRRLAATNGLFPETAALLLSTVPGDIAREETITQDPLPDKIRHPSVLVNLLALESLQCRVMVVFVAIDGLCPHLLTDGAQDLTIVQAEAAREILEARQLADLDEAAGTTGKKDNRSRDNPNANAVSVHSARDWP
ncbi:hypothetical protein CGCSCA4_v013992 [Colletotrichum siamense]|uniref:Uncharacterized protein n=1 Tax=Colletotrichum siamense TaxID=690259 RepID=A0A9P5BP81_COLSI|nr:hypothetical protein CGCSCA4_v013992 [Colletotrichum siamense]KAF4843870.1 hypothetical protein CGCSCA2_v014055 [Colletotrichum siamense]